MPIPRRDVLAAHLPTAAWFLLMSLALAAPSDTADLPEWFPQWLHFQSLDKVVHALLFAVAAFLLARSLRRLPRIPAPLLAAFVLTSLYGVATEIGQHVLSQRNGDAADAAADFLGAALGVLVAISAGRRPTPAVERPAVEPTPGATAGAAESLVAPRGATASAGIVAPAGTAASAPKEPAAPAEPGRVVVSPQVVFREIGGEAVLLHLGTQRYFTLDETGTRMWTLLSEHGSLAEVRRHLLVEYEVEPAALERDLDELVARLAEEGLVEVPESAA